MKHGISFDFERFSKGLSSWSGSACALACSDPRPRGSHPGRQGGGASPPTRGRGCFPEIRTKLLRTPIVIVGVVLMAFAGRTLADDMGQVVSGAWERVREGGGRAWTVARIKAAFADRKDISGRMIRVRFAGDTLQLAGFVPNQEAAGAAEAIAREIAKSATVVAYWAYSAASESEDSHVTHVSGPAEDAMLKAKVMYSLSSPAVASQFKAAEVIHVQVLKGAVTVFIVADEPSTFDLDPYVTPIEGVRSCSVRVVNAF